MSKALNPESDFGATKNSVLLAEHKFRWKPSEIAMILFMLSAGALLAIFIKPIALGLAFIFSSAMLSSINNTKKKKSILQLYSTPEGLKLYHNGLLIEESSDRAMQLENIREVTFTSRGNKDYIAFRGAESPEGSPYIKMPIRLTKSNSFLGIIETLRNNENVTVHPKVYDKLSENDTKGK